MMSSNEASLSIGEILRAISAFTNRECTPDLFTKAEKMCDILWQLLILYFDMPMKPFKTSHLYVLLIKVGEEQHPPQPFDINDLQEPLDRKKWIATFSHIIRYIQYKANFKKVHQIYNLALDSKSAYAELCDALSQRQEKVAAKRTEMHSKQECMKQLTQQLEEGTSLNKEKENNLCTMQNQRSSLLDLISKCSNSIETYREENAILESDKENAQKGVLQNVDTLPESIGLMKDRLNQVEMDMHQLFENHTSLIERGAVYEQYESLLAQMQDCYDKTHLFLDKNNDIRRQEEQIKRERDKAMTGLEKDTAENNDLNRRLTELHNQVVRQRLLLANKNKTLQAKKKNTAKELEAIKSDAKQQQKLLQQEQQKLHILEDQLDHAHSELDKIDQRLSLDEQLGRLLAELHDYADSLET